MAPATQTTSRHWLASSPSRCSPTSSISIGPCAIAGQTNSAFALGLLLDYSDITRDTTISRAVGETAKRLFATDTDCATDTEAAAPEMVSPCLAEAALMSRVLDQAGICRLVRQVHAPGISRPSSSRCAVCRSMPWARVAAVVVASSVAPEPRTRTRHKRPQRRPPRHNRRAPTPRAGTPPANAATPAGASVGERGASPDATPADPQSDPAGGGGGRSGPPASPRATWTGLAFTRADAYSRLSAALPAERSLECQSTSGSPPFMPRSGSEVSADPAAFDAPWLGSFAVSYLTTTGAQPGAAARSER